MTMLYVIVMAEVMEIQLSGYKPFFQYCIDGVITVYVNSQDQFKSGQKAVPGFRTNIMTEQ